MYMQTYYKGGMGHLQVIILWIKVYYHNIIKILSPDLNFQIIQYLTKKCILKIFEKKIKAPAGTCALVTDSKLPVHSNPLCYAVRQQFYERKKDIIHYFSVITM